MDSVVYAFIWFAIALIAVSPDDEPCILNINYCPMCGRDLRSDN